MHHSAFFKAHHFLLFSRHTIDLRKKRSPIAGTCKGYEEARNKVCIHTQKNKREEQTWW